MTALTIRQQQVFQHLVDGRSPKQAAMVMGISVWTVQSVIRNAISRMGAESRDQAIARAVVAGYVKVRT